MGMKQRPSGVFGRLALLMYRHRWYVLGTWLVILVISATQAAQVGRVLGPGEYGVTGSDSQTAASILDRKFQQND